MSLTSRPPAVAITSKPDVGREFPQDLVHAAVLSGNGIDEDAFDYYAQPLWPQRYGLHLVGRENILCTQIRLFGERIDFCSGPFDTATQGGARQNGKFVAPPQSRYDRSPVTD
jgi:hypothetical protein